MSDLMRSPEAAASLWTAAELPRQALEQLDLTGDEPALPSSFAVGTAAQSSIAAAALAAAEIGFARGAGRQQVSVDIADAARECTGYFSIDGRTPTVWEKLSGLYPCGAAAAEPGWVRIHANFTHHRDAALDALGLARGEGTGREAVEQALEARRAEDFEAACVAAGGVAAALRTFDQWEAHPQRRALDGTPLVGIEQIADAAPLPRAGLGGGDRPLHGLRILDLTRILAGPVCGRTLAAYGADVMLLNGPHLPNIAAIADTSRGKRSAHLDIATGPGRRILMDLLRETDVIVQGYRPGALSALGVSPAQVAALRPGIVYVSLSAYGHSGPWAGRRGFDSIVQTATGFNHAEGLAVGNGAPRPMPVQILDYASGFLMAFGAQVALLRQMERGGSWHVSVSLARTARWLRSLGRISVGADAPRLRIKAHLESFPCGFGELQALPHAARFGGSAPCWRRPSVPPGTDPPRW